MGRFRFRLQRVLDIRAKTEEEAALRLAAARGAEEAAREAAAEMEATRDNGARRAASLAGQKIQIGQIQNLRFVVERLNVEVEQAHREAAEAAKEVGVRLNEFSDAFRDRQVLDKLKDRALENWKVEEVQADRQSMDNIALARFVRNRKKT